MLKATRALPMVLILAACGGDADPDAKFEAQVVTAMHDSIGDELADLVQASIDLQAAAPSGHGWDATADAGAIAEMKAAWRRARIAYEHVEGATAPIFAGADVTMDARYDTFLASLSGTGDQDLFDDRGVTGMHAIERILYAPTIRANVTAFEQTLPGYRAAAFPATAAEANEFKTKLLQKLVDDASQLHDEWTPAAIDIGVAYLGLVGLMNEQKEKVNLAATGEEESRYSQVTLFDLRNNLAGTMKVYAFFEAWVASKRGDENEKIHAGFDALDALYSGASGDALPPVPETWSSDAPTAADQATPFGRMWVGVHAAVDPATSGSVVFEMNEVAVKLGFPEFVAQ